MGLQNEPILSEISVLYNQDSVLIKRLFEGFGGFDNGTVDDNGDLGRNFDSYNNTVVESDSGDSEPTHSGQDGYLVISVMIIAIFIVGFYLLKLTKVQLQKCFEFARLPRRMDCTNEGKWGHFLKIYSKLSFIEREPSKSPKI